MAVGIFAGYPLTEKKITLEQKNSLKAKVRASKPGLFIKIKKPT